MEPISVDYGELQELITEGLLKHDKELFIAMELIRGNIDIYHREDWDEFLRRIALSQMVYNVIVNLKKKFGSQIVIAEEGREIMEELSNEDSV